MQLNYDQCIVLDEYQEVPFVSHLEVHILCIRENVIKLRSSITLHSGLNRRYNRDCSATDFTTSVPKLSLKRAYQRKLSKGQIIEV